MNTNRYTGLAEACDQFAKYIDRTDNYLKYCNEKLQECDKKISDLNHLAEFERLSGVQMVKVEKLRTGILRERRIWKDDAKRTEAILKETPDVQKFYNTVKRIKSSVVELETSLSERQYSPRIFKELFGDKPVKTPKVKDAKAMSPHEYAVHIDKVFESIQKKA